MVNHLPAMPDTWVRSLDWEDPLEKERATHSSTLAWKIPWMEKIGRLQSMGLLGVGRNWATSLVRWSWWPSGTLSTLLIYDPEPENMWKIKWVRYAETHLGTIMTKGKLCSWLSKHHRDKSLIPNITPVREREIRFRTSLITGRDLSVIWFL